MTDVHLQNYRENIGRVQEYFQVSFGTAEYIYLRARCSRPNAKTPLDWPLQLQNAVVLADPKKVQWNTVEYGSEEKTLATHGVGLADAPADVTVYWVRRNDGSFEAVSDLPEAPSSPDGWTSAKPSHRKKKPTIRPASSAHTKDLFRRRGIHL